MSDEIYTALGKTVAFKRQVAAQQKVLAEKVKNFAALLSDANEASDGTVHAMEPDKWAAAFAVLCRDNAQLAALAERVNGQADLCNEQRLRIAMHEPSRA